MMSFLFSKVQNQTDLDCTQTWPANTQLLQNKCWKLHEFPSVSKFIVKLLVSPKSDSFTVSVPENTCTLLIRSTSAMYCTTIIHVLVHSDLVTAFLTVCRFSIQSPWVITLSHSPVSSALFPSSHLGI